MKMGIGTNKQTARLAGALYLCVAIGSGFAFIALGQLVVPGDAAATLKREQLKLEAALGNKLTAIVRFLFCSGSSRFRDFSYFQVSVQHGYPSLNEQVCPLIGPAHLPLFAHRKLTTSLTADSAILLLIGMPRRYRHP
jgi:hypothetical protein